jgi:tripartite ATP-independent transporter DctM subunit
MLSERGKKWLLLLGSSLGVVFFALLGYRIWLVAGQMSDSNQTAMMTGLPIAPFFRVMAVAVGLGSVAMLFQVIRNCAELLDGRRVTLLPMIVGLLLLVHVVAAILGFVNPAIYLALVPDNPVVFAVVIVVVLWAMIMLMVPIGVAMGLTGLVGTAALFGAQPALSMIGTETTGFVIKDALSVLPLFLLMGAFANVAGIGADLYRLSYAIVGHIRGGLAYASILACAGFGTVTGSSIATQMTIGRISLKEMKDRNYSGALASGTIASGGTLGQLLPPSSALILYAVMTEQSVGRLFIGAVIPGLLAAFLYMMTVTVWLWLRPHDAIAGKRSSFSEIANAVRGSWSVLLLLLLVLGGIYLGIFTELEAGSVGAVGAFLIALARGKLNRERFWHTMGESVHSLAMIYSLLFGATILTFFFGISGVPQAFVALLEGFDFAPITIIVILILTYLVLGTFMDGFAMMLITIPIFVPLVHSLGYDPIWWGIMTLICMEAGQISPPFGLNIFVISALDPKIRLTTVYRGCWPFFGSTIVKIILLLLFPSLATWLPSAM